MVDAAPASRRVTSSRDGTPPRDGTSSRGGTLQSIDALRGLAAILVVTLHGTHMLVGPKSFPSEPFGGLFAFGRAGVDFFFVLSGFVITYVHFNDLGRPSVFASFWGKRLLRIYPTYWIVTALYGALLFVSPSQDRSEQDVWHAIASMSLWPEMSEPILGVGWSLRHELLFYALFSLAILNRRIGIAVLAAWGAALLFGMAVQCVTGRPAFTGLFHMVLFRGFNAEFFFGIGTAVLIRRRVVWHPGALAALGGAGFLLTGLWESFGTAPMSEWPIRNLAYATSAAAMLYGAATLDAAGRTWVPRFALRLGAASYSIYLTHVPVIMVIVFALRFVTPRLPMPVEAAFVIVVAVAIIAGTIFSEWVEQPLLRAGRRMMARRPRPGPSHGGVPRGGDAI